MSTVVTTPAEAPNADIFKNGTTVKVRKPDGTVEVSSKNNINKDIAPKAEVKVEAEPEVKTKPEQDEALKKVAQAEKKARDREKEIKRLQSEREAIAKEAAELKAIRDLAKVDPFKALEKAGLTLDDLVEASIDTPEKRMERAERRMQEQLKAHEDSIRAREEQARLQAQYENEYSQGVQYRQQFDSQLKEDDGDRWEVCRSVDPELLHADMAFLVEEFVKQHGQLPSHESVLDALEQGYLDTAEDAPARTVKASRKLQDKLGGMFGSAFDRAKASSDAKPKAKRSSVLDSPKAKQVTSSEKASSTPGGPPKRKNGESQDDFRRRLVAWGSQRVQAARSRGDY